jgi:hypothetical protein
LDRFGIHASSITERSNDLYFTLRDAKQQKNKNSKFISRETYGNKILYILDLRKLLDAFKEMILYHLKNK